MNIEDTDTNQDSIIYDRTSMLYGEQPVFKPGKTPYTQYGNETLNANVPWNLIVQEIQAHYTQERLIAETGVTPTTLRKIYKGNYNSLDFRTGARILGVHCLLYPSQY